MNMRIKSNLKLERVSKIFHVSDVHIRNYKRHSEYSNVFKSLFEYIQNNKDENSIVCLTGDIVHSKTDVSPELFDMVQSFLKNLSDVCPVVMIPGNHDTNLNNSHRLDALTPVINALDCKNVEYIKDSCVVTVGDIDFYHWSVFDEKEKYPKKDITSDRKSVCLYHGSVHQALTDMNFVLTNDSMRAEDFDGFDMTLLGDIHKPQYLNEAKTVAYPGSLIQQNHGESLNDHGILVWNVETCASEYVRIYNEVGFFTLNIDKTTTENQIVDLIRNTPPNLYLRVKYFDLEQAELKKLVSYVKSKKNILETSVIKVSSNINSVSISNTHKSTDFRDIANQNNYIEQYLKEKHLLSDEEIKKVQNINLVANTNLAKSEVPRNILWVPKYFEFENMFSYGKDNYVDFKSMEGTFGLFAANASGKSTLLDSIVYCVFDKCTKTNKAVQVMNNSCNTFYCKLNFELNGLDYFIERKAKREKNGNVRVDVDFYHINGVGEKISMNGKDRNDTNISIRSVLGTYEDFVLTSMSTQSNNTGFIDMNQKDRKDLLAQFMDINVFEELYNIANESLKEVNVLHREYSRVDHSQQIADIDTKIASIDNGIAEYESSKVLLQEEKLKLDLEILEQIKSLKKVDNQVYDYDGLINTIQSLESQFKDMNSDRASLENDGEAILSEINDINASFKNYDHESILNNVKLLEKIRELNSKCLIEIKKLETDMSHSVKKMEKLKELKYDTNCQFCMENVFVKDAIDTKNRIAEDLENLNGAKKTFEENELSIKFYEKYEKQLKEYADLTSKKSLAQLKLANYEKKSLECTTKLSEIQTKKLKLKEKLAAYEKQKEDIEKNKAINEIIESLKIKLSSVDSLLMSCVSKISDYVLNKRLLENSKQQSIEQLNKLNELQESKKYYDYYLECMHRNGVPHLLMAKTIPEIESEINNILSQLVDFRVVLHADDKNINAYIAYDEDNFWPIELTSGMEKFVSSLAIRNSLISVSTLPRPNFIAIDEGFGSLDQSNLSSMIMMFDYLKTQFKFIMIISHIDSMKDAVDKQIEISKINGRSFVQHK